MATMLRRFAPSNYPELGDQPTYLTDQFRKIAYSTQDLVTASEANTAATATNSSAITALQASDVTLGNRVTVLETGPTAWTPWTPTITPGLGAFTTVAAAGRYKQVGKLVFFSCKLTITTVGTADVFVDLSLPVNAQAALNAVFIGRENAVTGDLFVARVVSTSNFRIQGNVAGGGNYPHGNGYVLDFSGSYEAV